MNKFKIASYLVTLTAVLFLYTNCDGPTKLNGSTGSGNPMTMQNAAQQVGQALCQVVSTCAPGSAPITTLECYNNLLGVTNLVAALGAPTATYPTFGALVNANLSGNILGNAAAASSTVTQVLSETCGQPAVQNIFTSGQANYSNVAGIAPASSTTIFSPTVIFRSVGPGNTSPLATGSTNAMTISGSTAAFTSSLPANVGVGDAVQFQVGSTWNIAFITSRISSTSYTLETATGGPPQGVSGNTGWSIFRAYTSIANALSATENTGINAAVRSFEPWSGGANLVSNDWQWTIALYGDGADSGYYNNNFDSNWTTNPVNFIKIYAPTLSSDVGASQRHPGFWSNTAARISNGGSEAPVLNIRAPTNALGVLFDGLEIQNTGTGGSESGLFVEASAYNTPSTITVSNCLIYRNVAAGAGIYGLSSYVSDSSRLITYNNIIIGPWTSDGFTIAANHGNSTFVVYNNTVVGSAGPGFNIGFNSSLHNNSLYVKNNIAQNNAGGDYAIMPSGFVTAYSHSNNISLDAKSPDTAFQGLTVTFVSPSTGNYLLSTSDTSAKGAGTDLSADAIFPFDVDILSIIRTNPWDIGASTPQ